jgi:hypothetical protein
MNERPVSYSELDTFRQCPMKWELGYRLGYKPSVEKEAFRLGHVWHEIMERHYLTIKAWQDEKHGGSTRSPARGSFGETDLLELCAGEVGAVMDKLDEDTRALMEWAYSGYVEMHGCDPDWRILATEQRGQVALEPGGRELVYVIDLVVEDLDYGGVWIIDHKFVGDLMTDTEIDLDDQLGLYWFAWVRAAVESYKATDGADKTGVLAQCVNGAMLNESRKKQNKGDLPGAIETWERVKAAGGKPGVKPKAQTLEQRFRRTRTSRTPEELATIAEDALKVVKAMDLMVEHGALYSSPNPKQCSWKCDFREQHILSRSSGIPITEVLEDFDFQSREQREAEGV